MNSHKLTIEEIEIISLLANVYNKFNALQNKHPSDSDEFAHHIHILQRHIMARLAKRCHPDIFSNIF
jgi:hypothetical protein